MPQTSKTTNTEGPAKRETVNFPIDYVEVLRKTAETNSLQAAVHPQFCSTIIAHLAGERQQQEWGSRATTKRGE